ncbi:4-(cytidine 5'-diphospho)-2-C-methyl-D-erythritol kinase [Oscillospiraceae bacterium MB08-C2-2]|nr:4-(cytidine 5'-diphospho)-2-C-methyl-D-erythritol kinase [Oscillospiraceae bacterium MB08-C2-2]
MEKLTTITLSAFCKVNFTLDILGLDHRGYHLLEMVMQTIDLADTVTLTLREQPGVTLSSNWPSMPTGEDNIAVKAARAFWKAAGLPAAGLHIHLEKRIPDQAGLGGGSADGAAVLRGLNRMAGKPLTPHQLAQAGLTVGADVPFCLAGGTALVGGIGEKIKPLPPLEQGFLLIAKPPEGMPTRFAFQAWDALQDNWHPDTAGAVQAIHTGDLTKLGKAMGNSFSAVQPLAVGRLCQSMMAGGALGAVVTGSGTAVVGLFDCEKTARACEESLQGQAPFVYLAKPTFFLKKRK